MNDAVYSCTHKGCSRPQAGLQSHTISPAAAMNRPTKAGASTRATLDEQLARVGIIEARSTKAGASTPATRGAVGDRRGFLPRSTKAGASTPATPLRSNFRLAPSWSSATLNEGRSVNPGYTFETDGAGRHRRSGALNEGRSVNPGYTLRSGFHAPRGVPRSTKAGASTPATHSRRGAGRHHRQRSTKAGASTPATRSLMKVRLATRCALNEGRSVNPGYTQSSTRPPQMPRTLNEGRSVNPGYTAKFCKRAVSGQTIARPRVREPRQRRVCVHFTRFRTIPRQNGRDQAVETALTAAKHTRFPRITEGSQISQSTQGWPSS